MEDIKVASNDSEPKSRMDTLLAAFDQHADPVDEAEEVKAVVEPVEVEPIDVSDTVPDTEDTKLESEEHDEVEEKIDEPKTYKAPQSWTPSAREKYSELPDEVKAEVNRREVEINKRLQETSHERKFATEIKDMFKPYELDIQAAGVTPQAVVEDFLKVSNTLRRGDQNTKAKLISDIIRQHNIDLPTLDRILSGNAAPEQTHIGSDPALTQRLQQLEQAEKNREAQSEAKANSSAQAEIQRFTNDPKNEFFNDVAPHMQHLLSSGQASDLKDAYDKAIWANPETRKVLLARQGQTQQKLNAASSVRGSSPKAPTMQAPKYADRRSAIAAAFDKSSDSDTKRV